MKILFLSDTHWELINYFHEIDFSDIELIVFLWDNEVDDLNLFKDIKIKKIWILWNHPPYEKTKIKLDIFSEYNIENIDWKIFNYKDFSFLWIAWKTKYLLYETLKNKENSLKNLKHNNEQIIEIENELNEFLEKKADIIISHFPCFWIMDNQKSMSHKWLQVLRKYIDINNPKFLFHWHLHKNEEQYYNKTKISQIFIYKIFKF